MPKAKTKKVLKIRIIPPHTNKSKKVELHNFLKKDYKKIEKVALDMQMLMYKAEAEKMFGNVYAIAHAQIIKKSLAFFILNMENQKISGSFRDFINKFGPIIINPEIIPGKHSSTKNDMWEGSVANPGEEMVQVKRYYKITVKFNYLKFNEKTNKVCGIGSAEYDLKGFFSQLFQNMIDTINGVDIYKK